MIKLQRIILQQKPVAYSLTKLKSFTLPGLSGIPFYDVMKFFFQKTKSLSLNERAAAISFNFIMAIPALLIFLLTLVPYLPVAKYFHREFLSLARDLTPNQNTYELIQHFLDDFLNKPRTGLLSFGFLLVVFYASNAMMGIIRTFDQSIQEPYKANFLRKRLRAIRLTTVILFVFIASILVLAGQNFAFKQIMDWLSIDNSTTKWWIKTLRWLIIIALFLYAIAFVYKHAPSVKNRGRLLTPGAFFASFLTVLTTWLFSLWVNNFSNFNHIYGSIGTVMILMILVFLNSLILLIGFELNISINYLKLKSQQRIKNELADNATIKTQ